MDILLPDRCQIQQMAGDILRKHDRIPGMAQAIERATAILVDGGLYASDDSFYVDAGSRDGSAYRVGRDCTCPSFANGAPQVAGCPFCQHRIAIAIYRQFIAGELQYRIAGEGRRGNRRLQVIWPDTYLLIVGGDGDTHLWSDTWGLFCRVTWSRILGGWRPATDADCSAAARWLAQAQPRPASVSQELPSIREWQPQLTRTEHRRWRDEGPLAFAD